MTIERYEAEELEDGRIRIRLPGQDDLIIAVAPGAKTMSDIQMMIETMLARRESELQRARELARAQLAQIAKGGDRTNPASPPALAELLISFLAPKNSAQALLGDLQEMFLKNADRFGEQQARRRYWFQVYSSIGPLLFHWLKRIGFFTILVDYVRSRFGL